MLALVDNVLSTVNPILVPAGEYQLDEDDGQLRLYFAGMPVESGVRYYAMTNTKRTRINHITGEFSIEGSAPTTFRAVFSNQHLDIEVWP